MNYFHQIWKSILLKTGFANKFPLSLILFLFILIIKKNIVHFLQLQKKSYLYIHFSIKMIQKLKIEAVLVIFTVYNDWGHKKSTYRTVKSIHSSFRSESEIKLKCIIFAAVINSTILLKGGCFLFKTNITANTKTNCVIYGMIYVFRVQNNDKTSYLFGCL